LARVVFHHTKQASKSSTDQGLLRQARHLFGLTKVNFIWHMHGATISLPQGWGFTMLRYRLAFSLLAAGFLLSTVASAWAFSQQSAGVVDGNSSFADPDDQITNNFAPGVRRLDSSEQSKQLGVQQQGTFDPLWWEQSLHGYGPYYQTPRNGN
jgi:hypothetical protein